MEAVDYLNNSVWATLGRSDIEGIGVVAIRDIPKGKRYTDYEVGDLYDNKQVDLYFLTPEETELLQPEVRNLILKRYIHKAKHEKLAFFSPNTDQILRSFMNHSDAPNSDGVKTLRDIKKGEEITEDYTRLFGGEIHPITKETIKSFIR